MTTIEVKKINVFLFQRRQTDLYSKFGVAYHARRLF